MSIRSARVETVVHDVVAADGRRLAVRSAGAPGTRALLFLTGTPSGGLLFEPLATVAHGRGLGFVTYSRPGYGDSTRRSGRTVGDCAEDVETLARSLSLEQLYVVGWSGGGPHALACAALLRGLVTAAATLAGVAPHDAAGLDWTAGMGPENVEEFALAREGPEALVPFLAAHAAELAAVTGSQVADALGGLVTDVDRAAISGGVAEYAAAEFRESVRTGIDGWLDDDLAFVRDWGFRLDDLETPVTIWQGAQDLMVPFAHGEWLAANVASARARLLPDEGHISLVGRFDEIVDDLLERPGP
jgi:pimeloyl-ACP methyl ester carboxylesterase